MSAAQHIVVRIRGLETLRWEAGYTDGSAKLKPPPPGTDRRRVWGVCAVNKIGNLGGCQSMNIRSAIQESCMQLWGLLITAPSLLKNYWLPRTLLIYALVSRGLCTNGNQGTSAVKKDRYQIQTRGNYCCVHLTIATPRYSGSRCHRMLIYQGRSEQMSWRKVAVSSHRCTLLHQPTMQS